MAEKELQKVAKTRQLIPNHIKSVKSTMSVNAHLSPKRSFFILFYFISFTKVKILGSLNLLLSRLIGHATLPQFKMLHLCRRWGFGVY